MEDYKFLFKVVLVGNAGVGKTCLVRRFTQGLFPPGQGATIGVDFMIKTVEVDGEKVKLQIWDTAGQERFRSITQSYYRSAHALILVYDISCQPTFDCLPDWLREIEEYANNKVLRILVGNKTDREDREIPRHIGEDFAQRHGMYFLETSAKEAENVERLFMEIAVELMEQAKCKELPKYDGSLGPINGKTTSQAKCKELPKYDGSLGPINGKTTSQAKCKELPKYDGSLGPINGKTTSQAKCKELPKYDGSLGPINGKTTSVGDGSCCLRS